MNAIDIMKYGQQTFLQALNQFPKEAVNLPGACGGWSVKDIVAHLASYEQVLVEVLSSFAGADNPTPTMQSYLTEGEAFNDNQVAIRKEKSLEQVLAELN